MWFSKQQDLCGRRTHLLSDYQIPLTGALLMASAVVSAAQSEPDIKDVFRNELACWLIEPLLADMPAAPLYTQKESCVSVVPDDAQDTDYFADDSCQVALAYDPTTLIEHCNVLIDSSQLGEGQGMVPITTRVPVEVLADSVADARIEVELTAL